MTINTIILSIPQMARIAERRIVDTIQLLDAILNEGDPLNMDAEENIYAISDLCDKITEAYDRAKSALNELQQG